MTEGEKIKALVDYRMEQADDALRAARTLIDAGLARDAVNRAYYAILACWRCWSRAVWARRMTVQG